MMPANSSLYLNGIVASSTSWHCSTQAEISSGASTILFSSVERELHVAAHRDVGRLVLVQLRGVDVDVDDLAVLGELFELAGHAVVEPHAQGDQQVGFVDGVVGVDAAVHAEHVERRAARRSGYAPRPITVMVTGMPVFLANLREFFARLGR